MRAYSVDGVKNPWSKALDAFKSKRWRYSVAHKKAAEKEAIEKAAAEKAAVEKDTTE
jgi:hypothetical protein